MQTRPYIIFKRHFCLISEVELASKNKKRVLNILLIPDNEEATPKNFRVRYSTLRLLAALSGIAFLLFVVGLITYSQVLQAANEKSRLEKDLQDAMTQLRRMETIEAEVDSVQRFRDMLVRSFQGYVQVAEKPDQAVLSASNLESMEPRRVSILTTTPLKTPVVGFVSQEFKAAVHTGIDVVAPVGTPVVAAGEGVVIFSGWTPSDGHSIIIYHPNGYLTHYRHNARNTVKANQAVAQGEVIAYLGNSGESSSGPHLHFEIWKNGKPVDPRPYLSDLTEGE